MEGPTCRNRHSPAPVARFNTFEEGENDIKAQIENASRTQEALRTSVPTGQSKLGPDEIPDSLQPAPIAIRKSKALDFPARPEFVNALSTSERHSLDRTFSFNSLSTLQRDAEAARLSQWRDSPVSAFSPTDRTACSNAEPAQELPDPCPRMTVYKLKQMRKDEKELRRSVKKHEKQQKKADKAAAHKRRHSLANDPAIPQLHDATTPNPSDRSAIPRRAISDPSFKAHKDAAVQLVKRLTAKPINRLSRRNKTQQQPIPHIDDFDSKPQLHDYLNSELPEPSLPIAELPGPLPPYTPFQNSMATADNSTGLSDATLAGRPSVRRAFSANGGLQREGSGRMMRCDKCQFGIKLDDWYLQCSICDNGDRIICRGCDAAGESCRHELTRRDRKVLGYNDAAQQTGPSRTTTQRRYDQPPRAPTCSTVEDMQRRPNLSHSGHHPEMSSGHRSRLASSELQERKQSLDQRDLEIRRREQDLIHREREALLRERDVSMQHRQTVLQLRESEIERKARENEKNTCTRDKFAQQCSEMAILLGSQFASLQIKMSEMSKSVSTSSISSDADDDVNLADEVCIRSHVGKRKASGKARTVSSNSAGRPTRSSLKPTSRADPDSLDEDDEDEQSGTPKKIKQDPEDTTTPGKLYACHFCKYDSSRYSDRNNSEKQYRGCSSGFWPDISRLKQHLYRVHWRNQHCDRCYAVFKKPSELEEHRRAHCCFPAECPYPEKFEHDKYNDIRKKRPANTAEEVWYIIYAILFPGEQQPATPYADSINAQRPSSSGPSIPASQTWDALGRAFESRLNLHQDLPDQPWLRMTEVRNFLREQLRASMADVLQQLTPAATPATTPLSAERSPRSANEARRTSMASFGSSIPASPVQLSATSTQSASSAQWRLPTHRRSFSRPLASRRVTASSDQQPSRPALTLNTTATPSDITFAVTTPGNPEDDQYDSESGSWVQNDDSLGLALTTDAFNFEFQHSQPSESLAKRLSCASDQVLAPTEHTERPFEFRPVKVSTLGDSPVNTETSALKVGPIIDSAYGSLESNHGSGNPRPRRHIKSTAGAMRYNHGNHPDAAEMDIPVPENELNMQALSVPFQDFLGADMDECGNIGGRSLTEYLYGDA